MNATKLIPGELPACRMKLTDEQMRQICNAPANEAAKLVLMHTSIEANPPAKELTFDKEKYFAEIREQRTARTKRVKSVLP